MVMNPPAKQEAQVQSLGWEDPLEKAMATCSSILAWEITKEPGRLQSWGHKELDTTERLKHHHPILSKYQVRVASLNRVYRVFASRDGMRCGFFCFLFF